MLRRIVGCQYPRDGDWVGWIKSATHQARQLASSAAVREWTKAHFIKKWSWAGHVSRIADDEWVGRVTRWRDSAWQDIVAELGCQRSFRPSRRRWMKFEDPIRRFSVLHGVKDWHKLAQDREAWRVLTEHFVAWSSSGSDE